MKRNGLCSLTEFEFFSLNGPSHVAFFGISDEAGSYLAQQFNRPEIQNELASSTFFAFELRNFINNGGSIPQTLETHFQQNLVLNFSGIKAVELVYGMSIRIKYLSKEINKVSYTSFVLHALVPSVPYAVHPFPPHSGAAELVLCLSQELLLEEP